MGRFAQNAIMMLLPTVMSSPIKSTGRWPNLSLTQPSKNELNAS